MHCVDALQRGFEIYKQNFFDLLIGRLILWVLTSVAVVASLGVFFLLSMGMLSVLPFLSEVSPYMVSVAAVIFSSVVAFFVYTSLGSIFTGGYIHFCEGIYNKKKPKLSIVLNAPNKLPMAAVPLAEVIPIAVVLTVFAAIAYLVAFPMLATDPQRAMLVASVVIGSGLLLALVIYMFLAFTLYSVVLDNNGPVSGAFASLRFVKANLKENMLMLAFLMGVVVFSVIMPLAGIIMLIIWPWITISMVIFYLDLQSKPAHKKA